MTGEPAEAEGFVLPASFGQERLWLLDRLGAGAAYHIAGALRLRGPLDLELLDAALAVVLDRHEVLRTSFEFGLDGTLMQVVRPAPPLPVVRLDTSAAPPGQRVTLGRRLLADQAQRRFDLVAGPLLRVATVRLDTDDHLLGVTVHHAVVDGWSMGVLLGELSTAYAAGLAGTEPDLPELPIQYGDFAAWQRDQLDEVLADQLGYWRRQLAGVDRLRLPVANTEADICGTAATVTGRLSGPLVADLRDLAEQERASLFMVLLAGFGVVLSRWCEQSDVVLGTPVAGRTRTELEGLIGFFVNTLPLRFTVSGDSSFRAQLRAVRQTCLAAYAHQDVPFERLVELAEVPRDSRATPLVNVLFALQNTPAPRWAVPGLSASPVPLPPTRAQTELSVHLTEAPDGGLEIEAVFPGSRWPAGEVERILAAWRLVLRAVVNAPDAPVGDLSLLDEAEQRRLVDRVGGGDTAAVHTGLVHELIEAAVDRHPDAVAVSLDGDTLTYGELEAHANRWAHHLRAAGAGPDRLVGVCLPRSIELIVALVAILKAGAAYLPLDPASPPSRLDFLVRDARPELLLIDAVGRDRGLLAGATAPVLVVAREEPAVAARPATRPAVVTRPDNLVYVIYTSGSTGTPKGAMNSHGGLANRIAWALRRFPMAPGEAVLHKTPISFDVSSWEWIWPLSAGARLVLARPDGHRDPAYLARLIRRESVTTCHFVPSMLAAFLAEPTAADCASRLRRVLCSGEELTVDLARRLRRVLPTTELHNLYGPAEASVEVTAHQVTEPDLTGRQLPIGPPLPGVRLYVLDHGGRLVPYGVPGELYIGGVAVGRGYVHQPGLTAGRFLPDPFRPGGRMYRTGDWVRWLPGGALRFLGRYDDQVKIRGVRVEPGEVELTLAGHPDVDRAVVLAVADGSGERRLVAYVACPQRRPEVSALRAHLRSRLPSAFMPESIVVLDALPTSANGKVDRAALPAPERDIPAGRDRVPPRTPAEHVLLDIWTEVLGRAGLGVRDDFYEYGGNSLRAVTVFQRAQEQGLLLPLQLMLGNHTVEALAAELGQDPEQALTQLRELMT